MRCFTRGAASNDGSPPWRIFRRFRRRGWAGGTDHSAGASLDGPPRRGPTPAAIQAFRRDRRRGPGRLRGRRLSALPLFLQKSKRTAIPCGGAAAGPVSCGTPRGGGNAPYARCHRGPPARRPTRRRYGRYGYGDPASHMGNRADGRRLRSSARAVTGLSFVGDEVPLLVRSSSVASCSQ